MERTSTGLSKLAKLGLIAIALWSLVRASTQSVTPAEAWNYDRHIGPEWQQSLAQFDPNNHVLNTIMVKISTARIHLTEFSLRLPSLLFGVLYLIAAYRISRRWFGEGRLFLAVLGLLTLNPLILDAMSEARGYGMSLACWMWALDLVTAGGSMNVAGALLGLSVAGSLAFLAPSIALMFACIGRRKLEYMPVLAFLVAFLLLLLPLNHAERDVITTGATSLRQTLNEMTAASLDTGNSVVAAMVRVATGVMFAIAVFALFARKIELRVVAGSLVGALALVKIANLKVGSAFPQGGAIYLIPIVTLLIALLVKEKGKAEIAFVVIAAVCCAHYADHFKLPYRGEGDLAGGRDVAKVLRADVRGREVRVGVSPSAEPILRYYKWRYRQENWQQIEKLGGGSFDYYVLTASDAKLVDQRGLKVLYRDSGLVLAK